MAQSNMKQLVASIEKAQSETMLILKDGRQDSQSFIIAREDHAYNVEVVDGKIVSCTCPHHQHRKAVCKHMIKLALDQNLDIAQLD